MNTLFDIAKNDLLTASLLVDDTNKYVKHLGAFWCQQSIEKTLKHLISLKTGIENAPYDIIDEHDIVYLTDKAKEYDIKVPKEIQGKAQEITDWEYDARYKTDVTIRRDKIQKFISITQEWHKQLAAQGIK